MEGKKMPTNDSITGVAVAVGANTAIGLAATQPTLLFGYNIIAGTAAGSVSFLNGSGGTALWSDNVKAQTVAGDLSVSVMFPFPIFFSSGLYVTLAGTAVTANVIYKNVV
jgi:hypothetical protein